MKNRISIVKSSFHVDEANKVVICILNCDLQIYRHPVDNCIVGPIYEKKMPFVKYNGEFTVRAKARCSANDTFNVEKGKRLAESRAKAKMFRVGEKVWGLILEYLINVTKECALTVHACTIAKEIEEQHIKELEA